VWGSLNKASQSFVCKCCLAGTISKGVTNDDKLAIGNGLLLEMVVKLCYFDDMFNAYGRCDLAVTAVPRRVKG